jgi:hypothetical protein
MLNMSSNARPIPYLLVVALTTTACNQKPPPFEAKDPIASADRGAYFNPPNANPRWADDRPGRARPAANSNPEPRAQQGDPLHYFTNENLVMIRRPTGYSPEEISPTAIWWTDNNGFHWQLAGYFNRHQDAFPFEVEEDGDYGIRFVGPGQTPAMNSGALPDRVYHVDTRAPTVQIDVQPMQTIYHPGQSVTISWRADDYHLADYPASVKMLVDFTTDQPKIIELQRDLAGQGSVSYRIAPDLSDHEIRFRVDTQDRAGNLGMIYGHALRIVEQAVADAGELEEVDSDTAGNDDPTADIAVAEETIPGPPAAEETAMLGITGPEEHSPDTGDAVEPIAVAAELTQPMPSPGETYDLISDAGDPMTVEQPAAEVDQQTETDAQPQPTVAAPRVNAPPVFGQATIPFATALARLPTYDALLSWDGATTADFPNGSAPDHRRLAHAAFDTDIAVPADMLTDSMYGTALARDSVREPPGTAGELTATAPPSDAALSPVFPPRQDLELDEEADRREPSIPVRGAFSIMDPTRGNGLLVPLPATVDTETPTARWATAHPWRILGQVLSSPLRTVWALPRPQFGYELSRMLQGRFVADLPAMRPVAEPGAVSRALAGLSADTIEAGPTIFP